MALSSYNSTDPAYHEATLSEQARISTANVLYEGYLADAASVAPMANLEGDAVPPKSILNAWRGLIDDALYAVSPHILQVIKDRIIVALQRNNTIRNLKGSVNTCAETIITSIGAFGIWMPKGLQDININKVIPWIRPVYPVLTKLQPAFPNAKKLRREFNRPKSWRLEGGEPQVFGSDRRVRTGRDTTDFLPTPGRAMQRIKTVAGVLGLGMQDTDERFVRKWVIGSGEGHIKTRTSFEYKGPYTPISEIKEPYQITLADKQGPLGEYYVIFVADTERTNDNGNGYMELQGVDRSKLVYKIKIVNGETAKRILETRKDLVFREDHDKNATAYFMPLNRACSIFPGGVEIDGRQLGSRIIMGEYLEGIRNRYSQDSFLIEGRIFFGTDLQAKIHKNNFEHTLRRGINLNAHGERDFLAMPFLERIKIRLQDSVNLPRIRDYVYAYNLSRRDKEFDEDKARDLISINVEKITSAMYTKFTKRGYLVDYERIGEIVLQNILDGCDEIALYQRTLDELDARLYEVANDRAKLDQLCIMIDELEKRNPLLGRRGLLGLDYKNIKSKIISDIENLYSAKLNPGIRTVDIEEDEIYQVHIDREDRRIPRDIPRDLGLFKIGAVFLAVISWVRTQLFR